MNTSRLTTFFRYLGFMAFLLLAPACDKKCQPPASEVPKTISTNPWRLISSSNPSVKNNNRFTFIIMEFTQDFAGQVRKVVNNREFETPIRTLKYNIETTTGRNGTMRIAYSDVTAGEEGAQAEASGQVTETTDYNYELGRTLRLTESKTGYTYDFVPFVGIVDPDSNCVF